MGVKELKKDFFERDAETVAKDLLGKVMKFGKCSGIIVETEAYAADGASHAAKRTKRSIPLFDTWGVIYVYLNYGMYYLVNVTCNKHGPGAVLIRAVEPVEGVTLMKKRRKTKDIHNLCNGPGKVCQAFGITKKQHYKDIGKEIHIYDIGRKIEIEKSQRIGISFAKDIEWRFFIKDNKFVSKG
jgi:DNA-3-methyladenine glycosylase